MAKKKQKVDRKATFEKGTIPDFKNKEYLKRREELEKQIQLEKEEYERVLKEQEEQLKKEEENVRKAKEYIEQVKREQQEEIEKQLEIEQPDDVKVVSIFNNYHDKRMRYRKKEIDKTNTQENDFRVKKYLQVNKLPNKPRTAKLENPEQVATMLVSSKKEIYSKSNKDKAIKKAKLTKEQKQTLDRLFLEKVEIEAKMINMFQPMGLKIPMYEIYWMIQNDIVSLQKVYKDLKTPFDDIPEFVFCDSLVWSSRYLIEMLYTVDYPLDFLKNDSMDFAQDSYKKIKYEKGKVNAFDLEKATIELLEHLLDRFRYSSMVVTI